MNESGDKARTVSPGQAGLDGRLQLSRQGHCALDVCHVLLAVEPHQSEKLREDGEAIPAMPRDNLLHNLPHTILVKRVVDSAKAEEFPGLPFRLFVVRHCNGATCFVVS